MDDLLKGNVLGGSCPFHPAVVHFPLTLYIVSAILNLVAFWGFNNNLLTVGSYYANIGAILLTIPAAITGFFEYMNMTNNNGPALWVVQKHIICNLIVLGISLWNWQLTNPNAPPTTLNAILSFLVLIIISYSGHMGGKLVYQYGVGVQRQGEALHEKSQLPNPNIILTNSNQ